MKFLWVQGESKVSDYMGTQPDLNAKMRSILIDWLIEVHRKFELMPETLYLTVNIVDRFLSLKTVPRKELQLVGISSMLIACKYEEIWAPEVNFFFFLSLTWMINILEEPWPCIGFVLPKELDFGNAGQWLRKYICKYLSKRRNSGDGESNLG